MSALLAVEAVDFMQGRSAVENAGQIQSQVSQSDVRNAVGHLSDGSGVGQKKCMISQHRRVECVVAACTKAEYVL